MYLSMFGTFILNVLSTVLSADGSNYTPKYSNHWHSFKPQNGAFHAPILKYKITAKLM